MLELYLSETSILFDVIQTAKLGLIHPNLISPQELLKQFLDIKIGLPSGTDLPLDLNENNVQEMMPLSDITIYYLNDKVVFVLSVPLVYQQELTLFQLIPIPSCEKNNCLYVKPNHNYLAITRSKELYSTYDKIDQNLCKHASGFLICPEIYPLHPRSVRPICEVLLLQDPKEVPDSCEIMHVQLQTNLFHKLQFKNEWIYASPGETIFITCDHDRRSENHFLQGVGILFINETCKAYATRDILIPHKIETDNEYIDFIPNSQIKESEERYVGLTTNILKNKHVRTNQMFDLNIVAKSTSEIKEIMSKNIETDEIRNSKNRHDYLLYVVCAITIVYLFLIIISCIEKTPRYMRNRTMRSRRVINRKPITELVQFHVPAPVNELKQSNPVDDNPTTTNSQNQPKDDVTQPPTTSPNTGYSVYPRL